MFEINIKMDDLDSFFAKKDKKKLKGKKFTTTDEIAKRLEHTEKKAEKIPTKPAEVQSKKPEPVQSSEPSPAEEKTTEQPPEELAAVTPVTPEPLVEAKVRTMFQLEALQTQKWFVFGFRLRSIY